MPILGNIFDKILNWQFTIPQLEGIWKINNLSVNHWPSDYVDTKFGGSRLNTEQLRRNIYVNRSGVGCV